MKSLIKNIIIKYIGGDTMVTVYATLILKGKKRLSQVPVIIRDQVEEMLKDLLDVEELPEKLL